MLVTLFASAASTTRTIIAASRKVYITFRPHTARADLTLAAYKVNHREQLPTSWND